MFTPNPGSVGPGGPNANISAVYKFTPTISNYITYNYSQNYTGDLADGGGFGIYSDAKGNPTIPRSLFSEESQLVEYGAKFAVLGEKLFISSDIFDQSRQSKPQADRKSTRLNSSHRCIS